MKGPKQKKKKPTSSWERVGKLGRELEGGEAEGEGELGVLALRALESGSGAGAEAANGLELVRARGRHEALSQGAVQVAARRLPSLPRRHPPVTIAQRPL